MTENTAVYLHDDHGDDIGIASQVIRLALVVSIYLMHFSGIEAQEKSSKPLDVVLSVDLHRCAGTWYEIARLPNSFQKQSTQNIIATCTLLNDGTIRVVCNSRMQNGKISETRGRAKIARKDGPNAKLKVRFAPAILSFLPFVWEDYWIINLASDCSYIVIGDPDRTCLWILSRTPRMDESTLQTVLDQVKQNGFDLAGLIRTKQTDR